MVATDSKASFSGETFTRRVVVPMAGMVILAILLVLGFAIISADGQNRLEVESSTALAETALSVKKREIARNLQDYAVWEDAYKNLHEKLDFEWASTNGNVGANIYEGLGYDLAFVVRPDGKTVYSVFEGVPQTADAFSIIPDGLDEPGSRRARRANPRSASCAREHQVLLVAATAILPPSVDASTDPASGAVQPGLRQGSRPDVRGTHQQRLPAGFAQGGGAGRKGRAAPCCRCSTPRAKVLSYITWTPATPGYELLKWMLPPLADRHRTARALCKSGDPESAAFHAGTGQSLRARWRHTPRRSKRARPVSATSPKPLPTGSGNAMAKCGWFTCPRASRKSRASPPQVCSASRSNSSS